MTRVLVHHTELVTRPDTAAPEWVLHLEVHDSPHSLDPVQHLTYVLPHDTLEWRAAEYGFHPVDDLDEVTEVVLMEPFLPAPDHPDTGQPVQDLHHPDHLYRADSIATARAHLRRQVKAARGKTGGVRGVIGAPPRRAAGPVSVLVAASSTEDPVSVFKRHSPMSVEHMAVKAEVVARRRDQRRRTRATPQAGRVSPQELRAALMPPTPDPSTEENP